MHWVERYLNRSYVDREYDCASLFCEVLREQFDKDVPDYGERPALRSARADWLETELKSRARRLKEPVEGCGVLMMSEGAYRHIGVYCIVNSRPHILHNVKDRGARLTRPEDLPLLTGLTIEGYYEWT